MTGHDGPEYPSVSPDAYLPRSTGPLPQLADAEEIERLVQQVLAGEAVEEQKRRLITPGATLGGARPKALLNLDGQQWVLKFNEPGEPIDMPLVEHATMTLAEQAGIRVARTLPVQVHQGHAVAVRRFDREPGLRRHALSANVVLKAARQELGYPELAQWLRRRGVTAAGLHQDQMQELFRRMVFNILIDNTDDHEKNHVLLMTDSGEYELSPAFDVLPSGHALGYQQLRVAAMRLTRRSRMRCLNAGSSASRRRKPSSRSGLSARWCPDGRRISHARGLRPGTSIPCRSRSIALFCGTSVWAD